MPFSQNLYTQKKLTAQISLDFFFTHISIGYIHTATGGGMVVACAVINQSFACELALLLYTHMCSRYFEICILLYSPLWCLVLHHSMSSVDNLWPFRGRQLCAKKKCSDLSCSLPSVTIVIWIDLSEPSMKTLSLSVCVRKLRNQSN